MDGMLRQQDVWRPGWEQTIGAGNGTKDQWVVALLNQYHQEYKGLLTNDMYGQVAAFVDYLWPGRASIGSWAQLGEMWKAWQVEQHLEQEP